MVQKAEKAAFLGTAEAMYEELVAWRQQHLEASFDEIADQVTPQRQVAHRAAGGPLVGLPISGTQSESLPDLPGSGMTE